MPSWGGSEIVKSPAQVLTQRWISLFGCSKHRYRWIKLFGVLLETYTVNELRKIVNVLHDRHKHGQFTVTSPAIIPYVADRILKGRFLEGKRLEIV